jgi:hypothetical protein
MKNAKLISRTARSTNGVNTVLSHVLDVITVILADPSQIVPDSCKPSS